MRWIPITLIIVCLVSSAVIATIILSLISIYVPNRATSSLCRISFASMISQSTGTHPMAVKTADFNSDGFLDLAVANYYQNTTSIFLGEGDGNFVRHLELENGLSSGPIGIAIADFNGDQQLDIAVVNRNSCDFTVFLGKENGTFSSPLTFITGIGSDPVGIAFGDLNNDAKLDFVITSHRSDFFEIYLGDGNGMFKNTLTLSTGINSGPYQVAIADVNNDYRLDIIIGNGEGDQSGVGIFFGDGLGNFSAQIIYNILGGPYALVIGNFNPDHKLDIVTANYDANDCSVLIGNGDGTFRLQNSFSTGNGSAPYAIAAGDFNRDTILDLIVANSMTNNVGILLGYGNGNFREQQSFSTGIDSGPMELAVGDFNGDNRLDFVSVNSAQNTIGVFLSTCS